MGKLNFKNWLNSSDAILNGFQEMKKKIISWMNHSRYAFQIKNVLIEDLFKQYPRISSFELDSREIWFDVSWKASYAKIQEEIKNILKNSDLHLIVGSKDIFEKYFSTIFNYIIDFSKNYLHNAIIARANLWAKENFDQLTQKLTLLVNSDSDVRYGKDSYNKTLLNPNQMQNPVDASISIASNDDLLAIARFEVNYKVKLI